MITINKINRKYVLTILLTFIFTFSNLPLDALSFVGINTSISTIAFAKSSSSGSRSSFSSSKFSSSSSKSSSGFSSGFFNSSGSSSKSSTGTSNDSTSSKSGEGFKSGNYSTTDKSNTVDSSASTNTNNNKDNNTQTYNTGPSRSSFWPFFGLGGGYFYRPFYFGSTSSSLINALVLAGIFVLAIILIKKYLNNKRK